MPTTRKQIEALIADLEPTLRKAFQQAIDDWRRNVDLDALARALGRGDIEGGIRAANIQPAALNVLVRATEAAFEAGGTAELNSIAVKIVFDARHLRGEAQIRDNAANLIQGITDDTRAMLRTILTDGLARGQGALSTARQVKTWIGITDNQAGYALNLQRKLETDPKALLAEFEADGYKLRDARLDGIVRRAVKSGDPIAAKDIQTIVTAYKNRSIAWRAKSIARIETLSAINAGRFESYQQAVSSGKVSAQNIRKIWNTTMDGRERATHAALNGESVGLNDMFVSPSNARLRYPGDKTAPLSETAQCRCNLTYRIDHLANVKFAA